jgi:hypothetical protein
MKLVELFPKINESLSDEEKQFLSNEFIKILSEEVTKEINAEIIHKLKELKEKDAQL